MYKPAPTKSPNEKNKLRDGVFLFSHVPAKGETIAKTSMNVPKTPHCRKRRSHSLSAAPGSNTSSVPTPKKGLFINQLRLNCHILVNLNCQLRSSAGLTAFKILSIYGSNWGMFNPNAKNPANRHDKPINMPIFLV